MILELATLVVLPVLAGLSDRPGEPTECAAAPCAATIAGRWTFAAENIRWSVDVGADGRIFAEGERSVTIGGDVATYVSTLEGTLGERGVFLSIKADNFSLSSFKPGPPTVCAGKPSRADRFEGSCASGDRRMRFSFSRD